jgi:hypothetical protein
MIALILSVNAFGKTCNYQLKGGSEKIEFTGFKFTEKTGVSGTFENFKIQTLGSAESIESLIENGSFWIDSFSLDAGKKARNVNIAKGLLSNLGTKSFRGYVKSINPKAKSLQFSLVIGKDIHDVPLKYEVKGNSFSAKGTIDLLALGYKKGFEALQKICNVWHKGSDGVSKTWSDVEIRVSADFAKKCL